MCLQRTSRTLVNCSATLKKCLCQQVRHQSQAYGSINPNARHISLAANTWQHVAFRPRRLPESQLLFATAGQESLKVEFSDGRTHEMPYNWLRSRCRCSKCSASDALNSDCHGDANIEVHPEIIQKTDSGVVVDWSDGHISRYTTDLLRSAQEFFLPNYFNVNS